MEESGKIVQQKKVENSDPEDGNPGNSTVRSHSTEGNTHYMVFTYFKGDINSKVDEHFSRALQQSSTPTDSNSKRKTHNIEPKRDEKQSRHQWSPPAQMWSSPYRGPTLSSVPMSSASVPMPVSQYRPDSHQNLRQQPHDPWLLPSVSRQSLDANIYHQPMPELHRMMPAAVSNRQYSSLLVPLRGFQHPQRRKDIYWY
ncbi:transcription cofactor vestigial-like protein 1 isoform X2 [Mustelus asterias]